MALYEFFFFFWCGELFTKASVYKYERTAITFFIPIVMLKDNLKPYILAIVTKGTIRKINPAHIAGFLNEPLGIGMCKVWTSVHACSLQIVSPIRLFKTESCNAALLL